MDDIRVKLEVNIELTHFTNHTLRQQNFRLVQFFACRCNRFRDLTSTDGTKQLAFITGVSRDSDLTQRFNELGTTLGRSKLVCCSFL